MLKIVDLPLITLNPLDFHVSKCLSNISLTLQNVKARNIGLADVSSFLSRHNMAARNSNKNTKNIT